ncbi:MAG: tRNA 2-thiouridine(34) synthase MnmA [Spirochaetales bacterium]|nr:tRNA 2-thiouridine(34) synthase MnmA [Spirochaetales bacterium]
MKIACLLSGGVDSSVALSLLKAQGHDMTAFYLKIWLEDEAAFLGDCPWEEDLSYARRVCEALKVPLEVVPMQREYYDRVVSYTVGELKKGYTPSPDLFCNERIKFGAFYDQIKNAGFDKIATGHYATVCENSGVFYLKAGVDPVKDQTYFLSHLRQDQLSRLLFPLGIFPKTRVRELAREFNLPNKDRKDSQGICFLGKIKYRDFVKTYLDVHPGNIVDIREDRVLGPHEGVWLYTIGQRSGLGLSGGPWYVVKKDLQENIVYVAHGDVSDIYKKSEYRVGDFNWLSGEPLGSEFEVKIRHGAQKFKARIEWDSLTPRQSAVVRLDEGDQGIAPGQFTVFYSDDVCLGCGTILDQPV